MLCEDGNLMPFEGAAVHTLSYDEKPGVQAIGTTADDRPPIPGTEKCSTIMRDYEYTRFGTLSLPAGIDLLTGEAVPYISATHKSSDFVHFLEMLDAKYPAGDKIRLVLDSHSAHTSKETQEYLNSVPGRFEFVFTPTHGSWLNLVEGFFSKMTKQMLNGIRVSGKEELADRIYKYFDEINQVPVPYRWSYNLDDIDLEKEDISQIVYEVGMFCQMAGKLHEAAYNRAYSVAADFFADRVIPFFQRFPANDPQDIVRNHGQFKDKFVAFKFAGRQPFHIHV